MPNTQGAIYIYNYFIIKIFKKYESKLDKGVNKFLKKSNELKQKVEKKYEEHDDHTRSSKLVADYHNTSYKIL